MWWMKGTLANKNMDIKKLNKKAVERWKLNLMRTRTNINTTLEVELSNKKDD